MSAKVLVIGNGGREHAICKKLSSSIEVGQIFACPGNAGTDSEKKCKNIDLDIVNIDEICRWSVEHNIDLVIVGPENALADGIADQLQSQTIPCFGPSAKAALIEASKGFSKDFMIKHNIPTARYQCFTDSSEAINFINSASYPAWVVKASGLAAGKGVIVANSNQEACEAVRSILQDGSFGEAGHTIVVEEKLEGDEISCLAFTDGRRVLCLPTAQDHKRLKNGDLGPNTGGMGAVCSTRLVSQSQVDFIKENVLQRTVDGMRHDGREFRGVLYAGIMLTKDGPKVLEFNCRFGDPEAQVLLPLMTSDLYLVARACALGDLSPVEDQFLAAMEKQTRCAVCVVAVAGGYPGKYSKGELITGTQDSSDDCYVIHAGTKRRATDGNIVTNGGRVLVVVALGDSLDDANKKTMVRMAKISFSEMEFRTDIGAKAHKLTATDNESCGMTYASAGVSIAAGDDFVRLIRPLASATKRSGCTSEIGQFGAVFDLAATDYKQPFLVSGTDGVGTKLKIAQMAKNHSTIGQDLVAMCVNDILCHGAEALFFLDYLACGRLNPTQSAQVVQGIAEACKTAGCALVGGETAEMPGMYHNEDYDLAGFAVGAVEKEDLLPRMSDISTHDVLVGVASSGLHSNGFSLVRKIVEASGLCMQDKAPFDDNKTLGEVLLTPTRLYTNITPLLRASTSGEVNIKALAHITGGGIHGNIPRVLPSHLAAVVDAASWSIPAVFRWLAQQGNLSNKELLRTFNLGLGLVLVVHHSNAPLVVEKVSSLGHTASVIGKIVDQNNADVDRCSVVNMPDMCQFSKSGKEAKENVRRTPIGVMISGSGSNLQSILDASVKSNSSFEVVIVISNVAGVQGLQRAAKVGVPTKVIPHKDFPSRESFEIAVDQCLQGHNCQLVCLAGFMRILSPFLVKKWSARMLNIHPSLLPSFRGAHAHRLALKSGVRVSGATVHFVVEDVDAGGIISQKSVPVLPGDTEESLSERVKTLAEHIIYPEAVDTVVRGLCSLQSDNTVLWRSDL